MVGHGLGAGKKPRTAQAGLRIHQVVGWTYCRAIRAGLKRGQRGADEPHLPPHVVVVELA